MNIESMSGSARALAKFDAASTPLEITECLSSFLNAFGFRHLLITGLPLPNEGPWHQTILYDGWPKEWFERYASRGHFAHDPCALECRMTGKPFLWSELARAQMSTEQLCVMDEAKEFGLADGLCIPVHLPLKSPAVVTVAGDLIEIGRCDLPLIEMVCVHAFRALRRLHADLEAGVQESPTDREREVLTWMAAGKSAEDVACILNISRFTVERHLRNVRDKLNAINTVHAVMEAVRRGYIRP